MKKKIVLALGGNALGYTPKEQIEAVEIAADAIVELVEDGYDVVIGHGNGPQVGMINLAMENSFRQGIGTPQIPLVECGAMSQGYIGYHLQQAVDKKLREKNISKNVVSVVTRVEVDKNDIAFSNPTKPIGAFYSKEESQEISKKDGSIFVEDSGRGYRMVVASPLPKNIVEIETVRTLVENNTLVITVGGGGIPVVKEEVGYVGVNSVIDKDQSCSKLAQELNADVLLILTAVEKVAINFNKPNQENLDLITLADCERYIGEEQFAKGSMLPKVEACMRYLENVDGTAIITSLETAREALKGNTGTRIVK